ncbi:hypothetical protein JAAARDRAFT_66744 [Jaapia argillacea MUCL 33604]|uniref:RCC1-like domain-containing protein n=1 Tax=Jaapia argillacea MUCL 33604 TaxID=933084 RepID=A0A067Q3M4_9AGAM|nr:hypothetical protein JAAARDRAFT_66744 [Jaapia argillacea MUCL 33604]
MPATTAETTRSTRSKTSKVLIDRDAANTPGPSRKRSRPDTQPEPATRSTKRATKGKSSAPRVVPPPPSKKAKTLPTPFNDIPTPPPPSTSPCILFGWGCGDFGQLGIGPDTKTFYMPKKNLWVEGMVEKDAFGGVGKGLESVVAGGVHTLFIDESGAVWSCGVNDDAALGRITGGVPDPSNPGSSLKSEALEVTPHRLQSLVDEKFRAVQIAAGGCVSAAISTDGQLRVWGSFRQGSGLLGFSSDAKHQFLPIPLPLFETPSTLSEKLVSVAAGDNHLILLTSLGTIYTLGVGEEGQLGRKVVERRKIRGTVPEKVVLGTRRSRRAVAIGAGSNASFAVDEEGNVWGWGMNISGQIGIGERDKEVWAPQKVVGLSKEELGGAIVTSIVGGDHHTLFLTSDGKVFACGRVDDGALGLSPSHPALVPDPDSEDDAGAATRKFLTIPTQLTFPTPPEQDPIVQVSAGQRNNLALSSNGVIYSWGAQSQGELGIGEEDSMELWEPKVIVRKEGKWAGVGVACGGQHCLALLRKRDAE